MKKKGTVLLSRASEGSACILPPPVVLSQVLISCDTSFLVQESPRGLAESGKGTSEILGSGRLC